LCKLQKKINNVLSTELCKILCICILSYQSERKTIMQKTFRWKTASPLMEERRQTEYEQFPKLTRSLIPPSPHILQGSVCMSLIPCQSSEDNALAGYQDCIDHNANSHDPGRLGMASLSHIGLLVHTLCWDLGCSPCSFSFVTCANPIINNTLTHLMQ
jgi:hypothetical protein